MSRLVIWSGAVLLVALAARLIALAVLLPDLKPDANPDHYRELGRNLAAGKGFVGADWDGELRPNIGRTPGYPVFLASVMRVGGDRLAWLLSVNCVLAAVTCALTVWLAARWLSPVAAGVAGLITALDPNSVVRCLDVKTEMLFTLLLVGGACLLAWRTDKTWAWVLSGLLWSLAALCRPIAMWLPVVAVVVGFRRWRYVALFVVAFGPLVGLWMARNAALTGHWMLSTAGPYNLIMSWSTGIESARTGEDPNIVQRRLVGQVGFIEFYRGRDNFDKMLAAHRDVTSGLVRAAPVLAVQQAMLGLGRALIGPGQKSLNYALRNPRPAARWWPPLYSAALTGLLAMSAWGAIKLGRDGLLLTAVVVYFVGLSCGPMTNSRFRYPIMPALAVLAVAGCRRGTFSRRERMPRKSFAATDGDGK